MKKITLIDKAFFLKNTPLFGQLDLDLLLPIADKVGVADYDHGERVFSCDDIPFRMFFLVKGAVEIRNREGRFLAALKEFDFFGDEGIFNEKPRAYEALCTVDTLLLTLSKTTLLTIISECPSVAIGLLQAYTSTTPFRQRKILEAP